jgi:hypothetical protein
MRDLLRRAFTPNPEEHQPVRSEPAAVAERHAASLQSPGGRDALKDAYDHAADLTRYLQQAIDERPREDVDAAVAAVRAELEPVTVRQDALIAELRREIRALQRPADAWVALLRLCHQADQEHRNAEPIGGGYARIPTATIRAVLDQTPRPQQGGDTAECRQSAPAWSANVCACQPGQPCDRRSRADRG